VTEPASHPASLSSSSLASSTPEGAEVDGAELNRLEDSEDEFESEEEVEDEEEGSVKVEICDSDAQGKDEKRTHGQNEQDFHTPSSQTLPTFLPSPGLSSSFDLRTPSPSPSSSTSSSPSFGHEFLLLRLFLYLYCC